MSPNYLPAVDDVKSIIRYLGHQDASLELTISFKGLVLQQHVNILEVNPDDVVFRTTNIEIIAALEGDVYLHHHLFPKPVIAKIKRLDLKKGVLVLSGFAYIDTEWKKRQHERVQPKRPIYVTLHWKGKAVRVSMENISVNGMGVFACEIFEKGMRIEPGSKVKLDFQLFPDHQYTGLQGAIVHVKTKGKHLTTIGIQLFPTVNESRWLEKYITPRKQEILEEINQSYWELIQPRRVESLYF